MDPDCVSFSQNPNYYIINEISNFIETDGGLKERRFNFPYRVMDTGTIYYDRNQYTTNNNFFGFLANVLKYRLDYYTVGELPADFKIYTYSKYDINCNTPPNGCSFI